MGHTIEIQETDGEQIEVYYFSNPMFHEDWHTAEMLGLEYVEYNHNGPDYWDDSLTFCKKDKVGELRAFYKKHRW